MAGSKTHRPNRARGKTDSLGRAAPTTDWLGFIRPHFERYRTLPWGKQKEFIDDLAEKTGRSENTLRRYIAAAELLESFGITQFPANLKRMPFASVEAIGRISKKDPVEGRRLLNDLMGGTGTIRGLKKQLAGLSKGRAVSRKSSTTPSVSIDQVYEEIVSTVSGVPGGNDWLPPKLNYIKFAEWPGSTILAKVAWPRIVVPLLGEHRVVVFDESTLAWASSPATVTREFRFNIAAAVAMFDFVLVYCSALQADVERFIALMRDESRRRILVRQGTLDLDV